MSTKYLEKMAGSGFYEMLKIMNRACKNAYR
jgi:hypothetical protein